MASESPLRRSEFLLDSLFMNSRPFSMERLSVEEDPFPDRRGLLNVYRSTDVIRFVLVDFIGWHLKPFGLLRVHQILMGEGPGQLSAGGDLSAVEK
ncbi:MAG: hypothetical protein L3J03_04015 [Desulfobacterales bacterium]|nr:hypothetical protein [Desulfobacterales bacterium]